MSADELPSSREKGREFWLNEVFNKIPVGQAWEIREKEMPKSSVAVKSYVRELKKKKLLPQTFRVSQRKKGDDVYLYFVNEASDGSEQTTLQESGPKRRGRPPKYVKQEVS